MLELLAADAGRTTDILALQLGRLHGVTRITHDSYSIRDKAA